MRLVKVYRLLASLLLPGLAILLAAFAQYVLTRVWPGIQAIRSPVVSPDGYFVVLCSAFLCFLAGDILGRRVGSRIGFACAAIAPLAFLAGMLWATVGRPGLELGARIAWLRPITLFCIVTAVLPLLGLALGWRYAAARNHRAMLGHPL